MANLFVNFPVFPEENVEPTMPDPTPTPSSAGFLSVRFDFSHYDIPGNSKVINLPDSLCDKGKFILGVEANNLTPGRLYTLQFELLNPVSNKKIFDPQVIELFASAKQQKFTSVADVDPQNNYIFKATIRQTDTFIAASDMVAISCNNLVIPPPPTPTPTPTPAPILKVSFDAGPVMDVKAPSRCSENLNIVATFSNSQIGKTYRYEFDVLTSNATANISPASGLITAGSNEQNINTILTISDLENSLFSLQVKIYDEKYPDILIDEDILLIKCYRCS